jgi:hypothetical protein
VNLDFLFEDEAEKKQHTSIIQGLVKELGFSEKTITSVYMRILDEYKREARIKIFLPILVNKKVKSLLLEVRSGSPLTLYFSDLSTEGGDGIRSF